MNYDGSSSSEQNTSANNKRKGKRICRHSPQQIQLLETYYRECPHPDESQRRALCRNLNLDIDQVKFWFQNKRTQSKAQDERSTNVLFRGENERLLCENNAMSEALKNVRCPPCGGPAFGQAERDRSIRIFQLENANLRAQLAQIHKYQDALNNANLSTMVDSFAAAHHLQPMASRITLPRTNPRNVLEPPSPFGPPPSPIIEPQQLSQMEVVQMSETATNAIEELKRLFFAENDFWGTSAIDGTYLINQESYVKLTNAVRMFRNIGARVESSKSFTVVPIEATKLMEIFSDVEKWKELFPTIVNKTNTIHSLGSDLPFGENCNVLQLIREQLHILSPLVAPREFMIVRCIQQIGNGLWIVADVSHKIVQFGANEVSCYKRPSGCLIQALPNGCTKVMWIEHVEVDDKQISHAIYRELLSSSSSGYGAQRWISTLERMCERMVLYSLPTIPTGDYWTHVETMTWQGRRNVMKLGERILKEYNAELTMSGRVDFPQQAKCGVRVSMRMNDKHGQPPGVIISAASCLSLPLAPSQVFSLLQNINLRNQWDVLSHEQIVTEIGRISTGPGGTNYINLIRPTEMQNYELFMMGQNLNNSDMVMVQDCYMDPLGGMLVYAPLDLSTFQSTASGEVPPAQVPILPSGFIISTNRGGRSPAVAADGSGSSGRGGNGSGTLLTLAFQILVEGGGQAITIEAHERAADTASQLISSTIQKIKNLVPGYYPHL